MKKYTVELVKRISYDVDAETAKEAIEKAKNLSVVDYMTDAFDLQAVVDKETEEEIQICESCGGDILPDTAYSVSEDDGYAVCEKCTKEAQD